MINTYVAFDLETTGLNVETDSIIEIGALKVKEGKVVERFMEFVRPEQKISSLVTELTGITNEMVEHARPTEEIIKDFVSFCEDHILVGHNVMFDYKFTKKYASKYGLPFEKQGIDTLKIARKVHKDLESKSLGALCEHYGVVNAAAHRAYHDALATAKIYHMMAHYYEQGNESLFQPQSLFYKPAKVQPATKKQLVFLESLLEVHHISCEKEITSLTRSEASKMIDHIILQYGKGFTG